MVDNGKIIQIMPAEKWWAFYAGEKDEVFLEKLVCWVVVTRDGAEVVEGMSNAGGYIDFVEEVSNFSDYVFAATEEEAKKKAQAMIGDGKQIQKNL